MVRYSFHLSSVKLCEMGVCPSQVLSRMPQHAETVGAGIVKVSVSVSVRVPVKLLSCVVLLMLVRLFWAVTSCVMFRSSVLVLVRLLFCTVSVETRAIMLSYVCVLVLTLVLMLVMLISTVTTSRMVVD